MITRVAVSGFRSLDRFELSLDTGLNVLVGPNGAGKSNILAMFDFIGAIAREPLPEAVEGMGGSNRVFRLLPEGGMCKELRAEVEGITLAIESKKPKVVRAVVKYVYSFVIIVRKEGAELAFGPQGLELWVRESEEWKEFLKIDGDDTSGYRVSSLAVDRLGLKAFPEGHDSEEDIRQDIENAAKAPEWVSKSILERLSNLLFRVSAVERDLSRARTLRIDVDVAREPEDTRASPGIRPDAFGVPSTLRHIREEQGEVYGKIVQLLKVANKEVEELEITDVEGQWRIFFLVKGQNGGTVRLPITLMSDGTVKWLSLLTAIYWMRRVLGGYVIEEIENYLHPWSQQEAMKILRAESESEPYCTVLVSTHSETILNCARPEEVLVCQIEDGVTRARRASNADELTKAIRESGFGLGYFYTADAIEHEV